MLLIGYGNAGRGDDGLGPAFAETIAAANLRDLKIDVDYQLTVDHAALVAEADLVVFADAAMGQKAPFQFTKIGEEPAQSISSHALTPAAVLKLASTLFEHHPTAYLLGIAGTEFGEVKEGLSEQAQANLEQAVQHFISWNAARGKAEASLAL